MIINKDRNKQKEKNTKIFTMYSTFFLVSAGSEHETLSEKKEKKKKND